MDNLYLVLSEKVAEAGIFDLGNFQIAVFGVCADLTWFFGIRGLTSVPPEQEGSIQCHFWPPFHLGLT
jgi:hypothetical protein